MMDQKNKDGLCIVDADFLETFKADINSIAEKHNAIAEIYYNSYSGKDAKEGESISVLFHDKCSNRHFAKEMSRELIKEMEHNSVIYHCAIEQLDERLENDFGLTSQN